LTINSVEYYHMATRIRYRQSVSNHNPSGNGLAGRVHPASGKEIVSAGLNDRSENPIFSSPVLNGKAVFFAGGIETAHVRQLFPEKPENLC